MESFPTPSRTRGMAIYATALIAIAYAFNQMDRMLMAVLAQPIKKDLRLTDTDIGLLNGFAFVAIYALAGLPLGRLADREGRRRVLAGSLAVWSLMTAACGIALSFPQLLIARIGVGVGEAGGIPASLALLADLYPPKRRALAIAIMLGGAAFGIAAGLSMGGIVAAAWGWRTAFMAAGLPGLLVAVVVWVTMKEPARVDEDGPATLFWPTIRSLLGVRTYRRLVFSHLFYNFITAGFLGWLPSFFIRSHHVSVALVGAVFGLAYAIGVTAGAVGGAAILQSLKNSSPQRSLFISGCSILLCLPLYVGALLTANFCLGAGLILLYAGLTASAGGPMMAAQQGVIGKERRALGSALSLFVTSYIGGGLGPLMIGVLADRLTPSMGENALRTALLIMAMTILAPAASFMLASRSYLADAVS